MLGFTTESNVILEVLVPFLLPRWNTVAKGNSRDKQFILTYDSRGLDFFPDGGEGMACHQALQQEPEAEGAHLKNHKQNPKASSSVFLTLPSDVLMSGSHLQCVQIHLLPPSITIYNLSPSHGAFCLNVSCSPTFPSINSAIFSLWVPLSLTWSASCWRMTRVFCFHCLDTKITGMPNRSHCWGCWDLNLGLHEG